MRDSGLSVGAIYTYFKSKEELFLECCEVMTSGSLETLGLVDRHRDVAHRDGHPTARRELEADALDPIDEVGRLLRAELAVADVDELLEIGPMHDGVMEAKRIREDLVEDDAPDGRPAPLQLE